MTTKLTWLGHAAWLVEHNGARILIDPFLSGNPTASISANQAQADFILLTHAHGDHLGDTVAIAKRTGAPVVTNFEVSEWLGKHGVENAQGLNPGGGVQMPFGRVTFTRADHSSSFPDGTYGGVACGIVLQLDGLTVYNAGDTALFSDMELFGRRYRPDLVTLPIGDYFTMGPDDAVEALRLLKPRHALPQHYNTFPPIAVDADAFARRLAREAGIDCTILAVGESVTL